MTKNEWCKCSFCGHKLFRVIHEVSGTIEIKCPSCKRIYPIDIAKKPPQEHLSTINNRKRL